MAKGIKSFKKGLSDDEEDEKPEQPKVIDQPPTKISERERERHKSG
jgi:Sec-independent protein translocase protein TatA